MHLIVGLGNPGQKFRDTRHNLGWQVIQKAARCWDITLGQTKQAYQGEGEINGHPVTLIQPQVWMNQTGIVVHSVLQDLHLASTDLIVVYDDLDLPLGVMKIKVRGGPGGHNGLRSVLACLGTEDFNRLKIGIGRPPEDVDTAEYVLSVFMPEELEQVQSVLPKAVDALACLIAEGASVAMNRFHMRSSHEGAE